MIIWINGAFGSGKTQTAYELNREIKNSYVYDPENVGYFIRENIPQSMKKGDFQDYDMWRKLNALFIKDMSDKYDGVLIIPMTIVNTIYFNEIIGFLRQNNVDVRHFTLMASKETLLKRLEGRGDGADSWAAEQIERCLAGLADELFEYHIDTEKMSVKEVAEKIASMCKASEL